MSNRERSWKALRENTLGCFFFLGSINKECAWRVELFVVFVLRFQCAFCQWGTIQGNRIVLFCFIFIKKLAIMVVDLSTPIPTIRYIILFLLLFSFKFCLKKVAVVSIFLGYVPMQCSFDCIICMRVLC